MFNQGRFDSNSNSNPRYSNEIMTTCMANTRESVHFRIDPEDAPSCPMGEGCNPSSFEMVPLFHIPSMLLHERSENVMGVPLGVITSQVSCYSMTLLITHTFLETLVQDVLA
jgi:hypothetical protein